MALVRRGETSIDELRRVAAEPARRVTEPAPAQSTTARGGARIGWWSAHAGAISASLRAQLTAAAAVLGDSVEIVSVGTTQDLAEPLDALVVMGHPRARSHEGAPAPDAHATSGRAPLVVALAPDGAAGEHVRLLAHDADVVLSANTHGRVVLATVLALLRWRSR
jgi:hypothetical protein